MLTRHAMTRRADEDGVDAIVVERDYVLAHVVAQLHRLAPGEGKQLVFKGGTALRFVHLDQYRYSADLDFTALGLSADESVGLVAVAIAAARDHAELPHLEVAPGDPPSVEYIGPLGAGKPRKIKLDIATDEHVETVAQQRMGRSGRTSPRRSHSTSTRSMKSRARSCVASSNACSAATYTTSTVSATIAPCPWRRSGPSSSARPRPRASIPARLRPASKTEWTGMPRGGTEKWESTSRSLRLSTPS